MSDIREQLNLRRMHLLADEPQFLRDLARSGDDARHVAASRHFAELRQIEGILATFQLADAQLQLVKAQVEATAVQRAATDEQRKSNEADALARSESEEATFWTRRFLNTIALASAAAFVSVLTFATKTDSPYVPTPDLAKMLFAFGAAATLGAITPLYQLSEMKRKKFMERFYAIPNDHPSVQGRLTQVMLRFIKVAGKWDNPRWVIPAGTTVLFIMGMMIAMGSVQGYLAAKPPLGAKPKDAEIRVVYVPVSGTTPTPNSASKR